MTEADHDPMLRAIAGLYHETLGRMGLEGTKVTVTRLGPVSFDVALVLPDLYNLPMFHDMVHEFASGSPFAPPGAFLDDAEAGGAVRVGLGDAHDWDEPEDDLNEPLEDEAWFRDLLKNSKET